MNYLEQLKQQRITVLGLGVTGLGIVRFLVRHGIAPKVVDSRVNPPGLDWLAQHAPDLETRFGPLADADLGDSDVIIISPGIALATPEVQDAVTAGVEVYGDIELFARLNNKPVVAVTGSNGKSTVVTLAHAVLSHAGLRTGLGGNIGTAVLDLLDDEQEHDVYVLELSSFQLETTCSLKTRAATILNVTEDHMDRYLSFADYIAAKQRIYNDAELVVVNKEDEATWTTHENTLSFALEDADFCLLEYQGEPWFARHGKPLLPANCMKAVGSHNRLNALAVMALLDSFDIDIDVYREVFGRFEGLAHRCQFVAEYYGVQYFNDSKATNVGATIASIKSLAGAAEGLILIAGGDAKGADLSPLKPYLGKLVKKMFCLGRDADKLVALDERAVKVTDMAEAVRRASEVAVSGDIVLLAPACASLDMYPSYIARGEHFVQCVREMRA